MSMTDPIADMLTRVRNGLKAKHPQVVMPLSKMKLDIARLLKEEGYIGDVSTNDIGPQGELVVNLRYDREGESVIRELKRISKPGLRVYQKSKDITLFRGGLGTQVVSTSQGIMTGKEARRRNIGGELIATVW